MNFLIILTQLSANYNALKKGELEFRDTINMNHKNNTPDELKNGIHQEYFKDGTVACEGAYQQNKKTGEWHFYLLNGQVKAKGHFENDKMVGSWVWYRENGHLLQEGAFEDEKKTGIWKRYHPNGNLYDEGAYSQDEKIGEWKTYNVIASDSVATEGVLMKTRFYKSKLKD